MRRGFYAGTILLLLVGCSKYENGPDFSMKSKTERLCNNWVVNEASQTSGDSVCAFLNVYCNYQWNISRDKQYSTTYKPNGMGNHVEMGTWKFNDDKTHLLCTSNSGAVVDYYILRLDNNQLWV